MCSSSIRISEKKGGVGPGGDGVPEGGAVSEGGAVVSCPRAELFAGGAGARAGDHERLQGPRGRAAHRINRAGARFEHKRGGEIQTLKKCFSRTRGRAQEKASFHAAHAASALRAGP